MERTGQSLLRCLPNNKPPANAGGLLLGKQAGECIEIGRDDEKGEADQNTIEDFGGGVGCVPDGVD